MNVPPKLVAPRSKSGLAAQLLAEIRRTDWEKPVAQSIDALDCALGTHTGLKRSRNDDRLLVGELVSLTGQAYYVAAVCDGVGGSEQGNEAATIAIASLIETVTFQSSQVPLKDLIVTVLKSMDDAVRYALSGRGTTTASVLIASAAGDVVAANVGDSRIFRWKVGHEPEQLSIDDTIENELLALDVKDASVLDERGLRGSLSQAIGQGDRTSDDLRVVVIDRQRLAVDGVILATDGLWKSSESAFRAVAKNAKSPTELVRRTLMLASWTGGVDNASLIAISNPSPLLPNGMRERDSEAGPAITAWIGEAKVVYRIAHSITPSRPEIVKALEESPKADIQELKQEQKTKPSRTSTAKKATRKSSRKPKRAVDQDLLQLKLPDDSGSASKDRGARPKVQVSADDDSPSGD